MVLELCERVSISVNRLSAGGDEVAEGGINTKIDSKRTQIVCAIVREVCGFCAC